MNRWIPDKEYVLLYIKYMVKWIILAGLIGIPCGVVGALFFNGVMYVTNLRIAHPWLLYFLPVAGLLIVFMYKKLDVEGRGTDTIVESARKGTGLRIRLVPAIFIATLLTHLCGGSSGREGAALQIGGDIGNNIGKLVRLNREDLKIATMAGMAAFFTALFGTPITATVFVAFFLEVGSIYTVMLFPGFVASIAAFTISRRLGMEPFAFALNAPGKDIVLFLKVIVLAALAALVSNVFVKVLHSTAYLYKKFFKNEYLRVVVGAALVILLTLLVGNYDYNGAGTQVISRAIVEGKAVPWAFLLKILFTALTLEAGFKGGEIVPSFFIGATFGAAFGPLLGIPAKFAAAIGMVCVFGGATNSIIAPIFLSIEAFGSGGVVYFAAGAIVSYMMSGYSGLYSNQIIRFSKLRARFINLRTNQRPEMRYARFTKDGIKADEPREKVNGNDEIQSEEPHEKSK